jgi:hypothetical protein
MPVCMSETSPYRDNTDSPSHFSRSSFAVLALALGAFLVLGAFQLRFPGLHYDEAREAGLNAMELLIGQPVTAFRGAAVQIGPWQLPLMVQDYIGALNVYLALPFLLLGGINVVALRWLSLITGALTLVLAWRVADRLGGPVAAAVTVILLAVSPTFVFWSRQGIFVTNLTALLFMAGLLSGLRWWAGRLHRDLWLTAFLLGLGVYAKLLFVWAVGALVLVALAGGQIQRLRSSRAGVPPPYPARRGVRTWIVAGVFFLVPLTPLILFNLRTEGTLTSVLGNLGNSYYGINNSAYLPNLLVRVQQLRTLLRGDHFWYLGEFLANPWAPWLACGLMLAAGVQAVLLRVLGSRVSRDEVQVDRVSSGQVCAFVLPLVLILLVVAQSAFTVSDLFITHYALIYPLIPLAGGLAVGALVRGTAGWRRRAGAPVTPQGKMRGKAPRLLSIALVLAALLAAAWWAGADLWTTIRYHEVLSISGGYSAHSDAVYRLAASLDQRGIRSPLALDWGLAAPVRFLTEGRVNPEEVFGYERIDEPDSGFAQRMARALDDRNSLYLAHVPDATVFRDRVATLKTLAAQRGLTLEEEGRFAERSGRTLFILYRAVPLSGHE